jgi:Glycosyl hydrolase family 26
MSEREYVTLAWSSCPEGDLPSGKITKARRTALSLVASGILITLLVGYPGFPVGYQVHTSSPRSLAVVLQSVLAKTGIVPPPPRPAPSLPASRGLQASPPHAEKPSVSYAPPAPSGNFIPPNPRLEKEARGGYADRFRILAQHLVADGEGDAVIRLGWEMNATWYDWSQSRCPPSDRQCFAQAWRSIVTAMRSVRGQHFKFLWCVYDTGSDPSIAWPGSKYVDLIGDDVFDWGGGLADTYPTRLDGSKDHQAAWNNLLTNSEGLNWLARFAREKGKPIAIPEWGLAYQSYGGGDDPLYMKNMIAWQRKHHVAISLYWGIGHTGSSSRPASGSPAPGLGVYAGHANRDGVNWFSRGIGRPVTYAADFLNSRDWVSPSMYTPVLNTWKGTRYRLVLSVPMIPLSVPDYNGPPTPKTKISKERSWPVLKTAAGGV